MTVYLCIIIDSHLPVRSLCFCVQVVVPTRVGQVYVYDTVKPDQDEYDVPPRHQLPTQQDIYDVPPTRQQYNTQVRLPCVCVRQNVGVSDSSGLDVFQSVYPSDMMNMIQFDLSIA